MVIELSGQSLGHSNLYEISRHTNINDIGNNIENIKHVGYGSGSFGSHKYGGQHLATCPTATKYSGDTLILQATPEGGIGPYYVKFMIDGVAIPGNDPLGRPYTIPSAIESETITRIYTLSNADIAGALGGTISLSVYAQDSCPVEPSMCTESCIIHIGCIAPVCNFIVIELLGQYLGHLNLHEISRHTNDINDIGNNIENIKHVGYGLEPFGSYEFGGQSISLITCPTVTKYSGDTLVLQATPRYGIDPYYVEFMIGGMVIPGEDPLGRPYTIPSATENETITRIYTLSDADIAGALGSTISFSVYIQDSCPIGTKTCTESCIINIGCIAPVCNFTVT